MAEMEELEKELAAASALLSEMDWNDGLAVSGLGYFDICSDDEDLGDGSVGIGPHSTGHDWGISDGNESCAAPKSCGGRIYFEEDEALDRADLSDSVTIENPSDKDDKAGQASVWLDLQRQSLERWNLEMEKKFLEDEKKLLECSEGFGVHAEAGAGSEVIADDDIVRSDHPNQAGDMAILESQILPPQAGNVGSSDCDDSPVPISIDG